MSRKAFAALFLGTLALSLILRVPRLDLRPMHHDEANQAVKFGRLLEDGEYRYDREDHHGPSLYYLTLPSAWLRGEATLAELDEFTLRIVAVAFAAALLLLLLLLQKEIGRETVLLAGLISAVSPVMVYYSRFYIQETLFVFFILGCMVFGWRFFQKPGKAGAVLFGLFVGMTYATKETCLIAFAALMGAWLLERILLREPGGRAGPAPAPTRAQLALAAGTALAVVVVLYSSFFRHLRGPLDSVLSFGTYFARAGDPGWHAHPWYYYLKMLAFSRYGAGPVWTEGAVLLLAVVGAVAAFGAGRLRIREGGPRAFLRFVAFYTLLSALAYSLIRYKTPWNLLPFYLGMVILAGGGAAFLIKSARKRWLRAVILYLLVVSLAHLGFQSWRSNFRYSADPRNPYVYAHTSTDLLRLVQRVEDLTPLHADGRALLVKVVADSYSTWPLPWYLRNLPNVGYWQEAADAGGLEGVPLVVVSMDQMEKMAPLLGERYQVEFYGLRPEVLIGLCIESALWEAFLETRRKRGP
ncbi:MAG: flippase activity-associated protein Agl23 [Candidatus Aminicenantaceae bacterium]